MDRASLHLGADSFVGGLDALPPVSLTVPLRSVVADMLQHRSGGMTHNQILSYLLGAGVMLEHGELSSCLTKLLSKGLVSREQIDRQGSGLGRRKVWSYTWVRN